MANNVNNGITGVIDIPGALRSRGAADGNQVGGVVAYAGDIYDVTLDKNQAEVNSGFTEAIDDINDNISSIQDDISPFTGSANLQSLVEYDKIEVSEGINASQNNEVYINDKKLAMSFGYNNTISNDRKLAFGFGRQLDVPDNTFVIGQRNSYEPNAAFIVGNGTLNGSTNNAFVIGRDGNFWVYGINGYAGQQTGTSQYNSVNHFITGLDTRLTALEGITSSSSSAPTYSAGTGIIISNNTINVDASQLDYDDLSNKPDLDPLIATHDDRGVVLSHANQGVYAIGDQSVAYGHSTNADGDYAIAGGSGTRAWGDKSVAFGTDTIAWGDNTIAAGNGSIAVGTESVAFGENAYTKGKASGYFGKGRSVSAYVVDSEVGVANSDPWYRLTLDSSVGIVAGYPDGRGVEDFRVLPGMYITEYGTDVNSEQPGWLIKNVEYIPQNLEWTCKVYIDDPNEDAPSDPQRLVVRGVVSEGYSYALGRYLFTTNQSEVAVGDYNVSHKSGGSAASGSGTIFSVGTGILSDNSEYLSESMADPQDYLISNQTYRANALEVLTDGSVYVRGVGGYDGKSIANVDSLQTVITDVNTRLSDLESAVQTGDNIVIATSSRSEFYSTNKGAEDNLIIGSAGISYGTSQLHSPVSFKKNVIVGNDNNLNNSDYTAVSGSIIFGNNNNVTGGVCVGIGNTNQSTSDARSIFTLLGVRLTAGDSTNITYNYNFIPYATVIGVNNNPTTFNGIYSSYRNGNWTDAGAFEVGAGKNNTSVSILAQKSDGNLYIKGVGGWDGMSPVKDRKSINTIISEFETRIAALESQIAALTNN